MLAGCPAPERPRAPAAVDSTIELGRPGASLRGVAGDGRVTFAAIATGELSEIRTTAWRVELAGVAGPIAYAAGQSGQGVTGHGITGRGVTGATVIAALGGTGTVVGVPMRGEPGAVLAALDAATGAQRWTVAVDSSEWAVITAVAATPEGIAIGGSFSGTLRVGHEVVSSAGRSDGFVARFALDGSLAWLVRIGGDGADGIAGVALAGDRVAVAGTVAPGADVLGQPLPMFDDRSLFADVFVAELDRAGRPVWAKAFGSAADDHVAGVAIDGRGRVVVAATARETLRLEGAEYAARGAADGFVAWFSPTGVPGAALLLGGGDFDGLRAICAVGDRVVVGGFFSGTMQLGERALTAGGGDDAFLAALDDGKVVASWPIAGEGREEIVALAPIAGGFVAGIAHTAAATIGGAELASPQDPLGGFGVIVRGVR